MLHTSLPAQRRRLGRPGPAARWRGPFKVLVVLALALLVATIGLAVLGSPFGSPALAVPPGMVAVTVSVPTGMRTAPFDVSRALAVPPGFHVSVYARVPGARFMVITPDGNLLVSDAGSRIVLVRPGRAGSPVVSDFLTGLNGPQGMAFHRVGATMYLYVGERDRIDRFAWRAGTSTPGRLEVVIPNLPYGPTADGDTHPLKDLAFGPDNKLYVNLSSSCNACADDRTTTPVRGAIYQYKADGSGGRLFAQGLRNAEGLAFVPGTDTLWAAVNERDNLAYPFRDATGQYGKVIAGYVDDHPPDELTAIIAGADYGWPYCNPDPDTVSGYDHMPFDPDYQFNQAGGYNPKGALVDCSRMRRVDKGIPAHAAPLGLTFLQATRFPARYRQGAVVALHGSWDRSHKIGYAVAYFPWVADGAGSHPGAQEAMVSGWLDSGGQNAWDRPVDVVVDQQGALLISADASGTIYKLAYRP